MHTRTGVELPRVLTPSIAAELGISRATVRTALRRGHWRRLAPGVVLTRPDEPTRADWSDTGIAAGGPASALSGWDALRLTGLGPAAPPRATVLVLVRDGRSRRIGGVYIRRTSRPYSSGLTSGDSLLPFTPVVSNARAISDAAPSLGRQSDTRALVAAAVQRNRCTIDELRYELRTGPRRGMLRLRRAVDEIDDGARSAAEAEAITQLRHAPVPGFEVNVPIVNRSGMLLYAVDVLWRDLRAVLEVDSRKHHYDDVRDWEATMCRHNVLTKHGLAVEHYPPVAIWGAGGGWLDEVSGWLRTRAREVGVEYRPGGGLILPRAGHVPPPFVLETDVLPR